MLVLSFSPAWCRSLRLLLALPLLHLPCPAMASSSPCSVDAIRLPSRGFSSALNRTHLRALAMCARTASSGDRPRFSCIRLRFPAGPQMALSAGDDRKGLGRRLFRLEFWFQRLCQISEVCDGAYRPPLTFFVLCRSSGRVGSRNLCAVQSGSSGCV
jgi:hypothetical protein